MINILLAPGGIALTYVVWGFVVPGISKPGSWQFFWIKFAALTGAVSGLFVGAICVLFHWTSFGHGWLLTLNAITYAVAAFILTAWLAHLAVMARLGKEAYATYLEHQREQSPSDIPAAVEFLGVPQDANTPQ